MVKVLCIVQARLTSSRLPNKVLMPLGAEGKTILEHVYERLTSVPSINQVVFAIPDNALNDQLEEFLKAKSIPYFRGSENDVLSRFYQCARIYEPEIIVRATCDNPLVDISLAESLIKHLPPSNYIHCTGCSLGTSVEVFTMSALQAAYANATSAAEHEHVTPYIWANKHLFQISDYPYQGPAYRLTVDEEKDYELMQSIYNHLYAGKPISNDVVYQFLESNKEIASINNGVEQKTI